LHALEKNKKNKNYSQFPCFRLVTTCLGHCHIRPLNTSIRVTTLYSSIGSLPTVRSDRVTTLWKQTFLFGWSLPARVTALCTSLIYIIQGHYPVLHPYYIRLLVTTCLCDYPVSVIILLNRLLFTRYSRELDKWYKF
jgi:hypothetical protein